MKFCFTIDTEKDYKTGSYESIVSGFRKLQPILAKHHIRPTLFVTCDCIEKYPKLFNEFKKRGWEISLHGYRHLRFDEMNKKQKEENLNKAIKCFKKYLKTSPIGLRAPQFSSDYELILLANKKGFSYDSSIVQFPPSQFIFFRSKLPLFLKQMKFKSLIKKNNLKIKEIPSSSFILPISVFSLRKLPFFIFRILARLSIMIRKDSSLVFLSHSYEFNDKVIAKIDKFLNLYKDSFFITMSELSKLQ